MHHDNRPADQPMHYVVGRFMQAGTPVPEGFDFVDLAPSAAALAVIRGEFDEMIWPMYAATRDRILSDGRGIPYPEGYFHAEVYLKDNIPRSGAVSRLAYLFACTPEKNLHEMKGFCSGRRNL